MGKKVSYIWHQWESSTKQASKQALGEDARFSVQAWPSGGHGPLGSVGRNIPVIRMHQPAALSKHIEYKKSHGSLLLLDSRLPESPLMLANELCNSSAGMWRVSLRTLASRCARQVQCMLEGTHWYSTQHLPIRWAWVHLWLHSNSWYPELPVIALASLRPG